MSLVDDLAKTYAEKRDKNQKKAEVDTEKLIKNQINSITHRLQARASAGANELRLVSKSVHPEVANHFRREGLIVWVNDEVTVIRIPLQHN